MARDRTSGDKAAWAEDDLISKLVTDPGQVPETQTLSGYVGRSDRPGYWRLYLSAELDEFVECREDDVLHTEKSSADQGPLGNTMVWIKRDARLLHSQPTSRPAQGDFLVGDITRDFLAAGIPDSGAEAAFIRTIIIRISRRVCTRASICRPCSVASLCNVC